MVATPDLNLPIGVLHDPLRVVALAVHSLDHELLATAFIHLSVVSVALAALVGGDHPSLREGIWGVIGVNKGRCELVIGVVQDSYDAKDMVIFGELC